MAKHVNDMNDRAFERHAAAEVRNAFRAETRFAGRCSLSNRVRLHITVT